MTSLETDRVDGRGLEVRFTWAGDRYCHCVSALDGEKRHPLLTAIAGDDRSDWPASPPFQQVIGETRDTSRVALLVGMAGKSHWSASIESPNQDPQLTFDIACLAQQEPAWLGSSYRVDAEAVTLCTDSMVLDSPAGKARLRIVTDASSPLDLDVQGRSAIIRVAVERNGFAPQTLRWKYTVQLITSR